jgi:hypothetical protein
LPLHFLSPGTQTPMQLPPLQTKGQSEPFVYVPVLSQVWGVLFMHFFEGGLQMPPHVPEVTEPLTVVVMQTLGHGVLSTHAPEALQSCWVNPLHRVRVGKHAPAQAAGATAELQKKGQGPGVHTPSALHVSRVIGLEHLV